MPDVVSGSASLSSVSSLSATTSRVLGPSSPASITVAAPSGGIINTPSFDMFDGAYVLTDNEGTFTFSNLNFTMEASEYPPAPSTNRYSAWFTWTPTFSGSARVHTRNSPDADTANADVRIYEDIYADAATAYGNDIQLRPTLNADGSAYSDTDDAYWYAEEGTTYRIQVMVDTPFADNVIQWGPAPIAANDDFINAFQLLGDSGTVYWANLYSTTEPSESGVGSYGALGWSLWYYWTASADGPATFDTTGSGSVDTTLEVFTGSDLASLVLAASNDSGSGAASVTFTATAGVTYYVRLNARQDVALGGTMTWSGATPAGGSVAPIDCRITVGVYDPDGVTLLAYLPRRRAVRWQSELNGVGGASFDIHLDDATLETYPEVLEYFNIVKYFLNGKPIIAWQIEEITKSEVQPDEGSGRWVTVSGRGALSLLETAIVYPEYGMSQITGEDRHFDFSSKDGVWRNQSEWTKPVGFKYKDDTTVRKGKPVGWPDPDAYWIWSTSPSATATPGRNWFRTTFTLSTATSVVMYLACDDTFVLHVDGTIVRMGEPGKYYGSVITTYKTKLSAGTHTIAIAADNFKLADASAYNPGALIFTMYQAYADGTRTATNLLRSDLTRWLVKGYGATPGWHAATILQQLVEEAKERKVRSVLPITYTFTNVIDSSGQPWGDVQDRTVKIGTTDLLSLSTELIELSMDLEIDGNLKMNAWKHRGFDRSGTVRLIPGRDLTSVSTTGRGGKTRNRAVLKSGGGWVELSSASSQEEWGRREVGLSVGNAGSTNQLALVGSAAMSELSQPDRTIPIEYTSASGPQPYQDFDLGDVIAVPVDNTGNSMTAARVMAITGEEDDNVIRWQLDLYPQVPPDSIDVIPVTTGTEYGNPSELYAKEVMSDSPWGYWRLAETSGTTRVDASGHKRHMTISGSGMTFGTAGPIAKAMSFNSGNTGYGVVKNYLFKQGTATVEAWVMLTATPTAITNILGMTYPGMTGATHDKELYVGTDSKVRFRVYVNGASRVALFNTALTHNVWYHVVGSIGAAGLKLYVNGTKRVSNSTYKGSIYTGEYVYMHAGGVNFNGRAPMKVAEPAIYFQQLLDSRIMSHYKAGVGLV